MATKKQKSSNIISAYDARPHRLLKRAVMVGLALFYFVSNGLLCSALETNFWKERQTATKARAENEIPSARNLETLPAQASTSNPLPVRSGALRSAGDENFPKGLSASARLRLEKVLPVCRAHGTLRDIQAPSAPNAANDRVVVLLQDVHMNSEAQQNIAEIIEGIGAIEPAFVGVEGAVGDLHPETLRSADAAVNREMGAILFNAKLIQGPELGLFWSTSLTRFWGIEDAALYEKNVAAVKNSLPRKEKFQTEIAAVESQLAGRMALASPAANNIFKLKMDYEAGRLSFGSYAAALAAMGNSAGNSAPGSALSAFLDAVRLESTFDPKSLERERNSIFNDLTAKGSPESLNAIKEDAVLYKAGRLSPAAFTGNLRMLAMAAGVDVKRRPHFERYAHYLAAAEKLSTEKVLEDVAVLEAQTCQSPRLSPSDQAALRLAWNVSLLKKLGALSLTPSEWKELNAQKDLVPTFEALLDPARRSAFKDDFDSFHSFYSAADNRNQALLNNFKLEAKESLTVLVAGGFHTEALRSALAKDAALVVVSPKLTAYSPGDTVDALSTFLLEKTPLEKLFESVPLTLASRLSLGGGPHEKTTLGLIRILRAQLPLVFQKGAVSIVVGPLKIFIALKEEAKAFVSRASLLLKGDGERVTLRVTRAPVPSLQNILARKATSPLGILIAEKIATALGRGPQAGGRYYIRNAWWLEDLIPAALSISLAIYANHSASYGRLLLGAFVSALWIVFFVASHRVSPSMAATYKLIPSLEKAVAMGALQAFGMAFSFNMFSFGLASNERVLVTALFLALIWGVISALHYDDSRREPRQYQESIVSRIARFMGIHSQSPSMPRWAEIGVSFFVAAAFLYWGPLSFLVVFVGFQETLFSRLTIPVVLLSGAWIVAFLGARRNFSTGLLGGFIQNGSSGRDGGKGRLLVTGPLFEELQYRTIPLMASAGALLSGLSVLYGATSLSRFVSAPLFLFFVLLPAGFYAGRAALKRTHARFVFDLHKRSHTDQERFELDVVTKPWNDVALAGTLAAFAALWLGTTGVPSLPLVGFASLSPIPFVWLASGLLGSLPVILQHSFYNFRNPQNPASGDARITGPIYGPPIETVSVGEETAHIVRLQSPSGRIFPLIDFMPGEFLVQEKSGAAQYYFSLGAKKRVRFSIGSIHDESSVYLDKANNSRTTITTECDVAIEFLNGFTVKRLNSKTIEWEIQPDLDWRISSEETIKISHVQSIHILPASRTDLSPLKGEFPLILITYLKDDRARQTILHPEIDYDRWASDGMLVDKTTSIIKAREDLQGLKYVAFNGGAFLYDDKDEKNLVLGASLVDPKSAEPKIRTIYFNGLIQMGSFLYYYSASKDTIIGIPFAAEPTPSESLVPVAPAPIPVQEPKAEPLASNSDDALMVSAKEVLGRWLIVASQFDLRWFGSFADGQFIAFFTLNSAASANLTVGQKIVLVGNNPTDVYFFNEERNGLAYFSTSDQENPEQMSLSKDSTGGMIVTFGEVQHAINPIKVSILPSSGAQWFEGRGYAKRAAFFETGVARVAVPIVTALLLGSSTNSSWMWALVALSAPLTFWGLHIFRSVGRERGQWNFQWRNGRAALTSPSVRLVTIATAVGSLPLLFVPLVGAMAVVVYAVVLIPVYWLHRQIDANENPNLAAQNFSLPRFLKETPAFFRAATTQFNFPRLRTLVTRAPPTDSFREEKRGVAYYFVAFVFRVISLFEKPPAEAEPISIPAAPIESSAGPDTPGGNGDKYEPKIPGIFEEIEPLASSKADDLGQWPILKPFYNAVTTFFALKGFPRVGHVVGQAFLPALIESGFFVFGGAVLTGYVFEVPTGPTRAFLFILAAWQLAWQLGHGRNAFARTQRLITMGTFLLLSTSFVGAIAFNPLVIVISVTAAHFFGNLVLPASGERTVEPKETQPLQTRENPPIEFRLSPREIADIEANAGSIYEPPLPDIFEGMKPTPLPKSDAASRRDFLLGFGALLGLSPFAAEGASIPLGNSEGTKKTSSPPYSDPELEMITRVVEKEIRSYYDALLKNLKPGVNFDHKRSAALHLRKMVTLILNMPGVSSIDEFKDYFSPTSDQRSLNSLEGFLDRLAAYYATNKKVFGFPPIDLAVNGAIHENVLNFYLYDEAEIDNKSIVRPYIPGFSVDYKIVGVRQMRIPPVDLLVRETVNNASSTNAWNDSSGPEGPAIYLDLDAAAERAGLIWDDVAINASKTDRALLFDIKEAADVMAKTGNMAPLFVAGGVYLYRRQFGSDLNLPREQFIAKAVPFLLNESAVHELWHVISNAKGFLSDQLPANDYFVLIEALAGAASVAYGKTPLVSFMLFRRWILSGTDYELAGKKALARLMGFFIGGSSQFPELRLRVFGDVNSLEAKAHYESKVAELSPSQMQELARTTMNSFLALSTPLQKSTAPLYQPPAPYRVSGWNNYFESASRPAVIGGAGVSIVVLGVLWRMKRMASLRLEAAKKKALAKAGPKGGKPSNNKKRRLDKGLILGETGNKFLDYLFTPTMEEVLFRIIPLLSGSFTIFVGASVLFVLLHLFTKANPPTLVGVSVWAKFKSRFASPAEIKARFLNLDLFAQRTFLPAVISLGSLSFLFLAGGFDLAHLSGFQVGSFGALSALFHILIDRKQNALDRVAVVLHRHIKAVPSSGPNEFVLRENESPAVVMAAVLMKGGLSKTNWLVVPAAEEEAYKLMARSLEKLAGETGARATFVVKPYRAETEAGLLIVGDKTTFNPARLAPNFVMAGVAQENIQFVLSGGIDVDGDQTLNISFLNKLIPPAMQQSINTLLKRTISALIAA